MSLRSVHSGDWLTMIIQTIAVVFLLGLGVGMGGVYLGMSLADDCAVEAPVKEQAK